MSSHDVIGVLRSFCEDTTVDAKPRIDVLHILEEVCSLLIWLYVLWVGPWGGRGRVGGGGKCNISCG